VSKMGLAIKSRAQHVNPAARLPPPETVESRVAPILRANRARLSSKAKLDGDASGSSPKRAAYQVLESSLVRDHPEPLFRVLHARFGAGGMPRPPRGTNNAAVAAGWTTGTTFTKVSFRRSLASSVGRPVLSWASGRSSVGFEREMHFAPRGSRDGCVASVLSPSRRKPNATLSASYINPTPL
jgi:hypothetical protein